LETLVDCLESFLSNGNVCSQIIGVNLGNLVEGQLTNHLHDKKVNELCGVRRTKGEGELVCYSFQQPLQ
jgi:hypothetical protein